MHLYVAHLMAADRRRELLAEADADRAAALARTTRRGPAADRESRRARIGAWFASARRVVTRAAGA